MPALPGSVSLGQGWLEFAIDRYDEVETRLRQVREAGGDVMEMKLGEPDLEKVFVGVMQSA